MLLGFCLLFLLAATAYYALAAVAAWRFRLSPGPEADFTPPVSILKPLHGVPRGLAEALTSFCRQDYPEYEVICCVGQENDPAVPIVETLQRSFSHVRLVIADRHLGANAKVSSLDKMCRAAQHRFLAASDDDIVAGPDYLRRIVGYLRDPQTGIVTCPYRGRPAGTAASLVQALGISGEFFCGVLMAWMLEGVRFGMGSTVALRKELIEKIGGWEAIADHLADDYEIGHRAFLAGYRNVLAPYPVETLLHAAGWRDMLRHQLRWMQAQAVSRPWSHAGLLVTYGAPWALASLAQAPWSPLIWSLAGAWLAARLAGAWAAGGVVLRDPALRRWWLLLPARELLAFALWLISLVHRKTIWRDEEFDIVEGRLSRRG